MKLMSNFGSKFLILIFLALPVSVFAWGNQGHHIIASLAGAQLTSKARAEVDRLLALEPAAVRPYGQAATRSSPSPS